MSLDAYQPIACADHERLEFAALTKQWMALRVDGTACRLLPLDVYTRDSAEWLKAQDEAGGTLIIRLDRLGF